MKRKQKIINILLGNFLLQGFAGIKPLHAGWPCPTIIDFIDGNVEGDTELHLAIRDAVRNKLKSYMDGGYRSVQKLIDEGADINATNAKGKTPLGMIRNLKFDLERDPKKGLKVVSGRGLVPKGRFGSRYVYVIDENEVIPLLERLIQILREAGGEKNSKDSFE